jgi:hypothetical protein
VNTIKSVTTAFATMVAAALIYMAAIYQPADGQQGGGAPPAAPKPIICTTACAVPGLKVGQLAVITKGTTTNRASTISPTNDPDLQFTSVPAGTYILELNVLGNWGAGGMAVLPMNAVVSSFAGGGVMLCGTSNTAVTDTNNGSNVNGYLCASSASASPVGMQFHGMLVTSSSLTIPVAWAQNISNATNSSVLQNSTYSLFRTQ